MLLKQWFSKKRALGEILIIPFVSQILFIGLLIGTLSYINGKSSVDKITDNLRSEVTNRIEEHFLAYLTIPYHINQTNANLLSDNILNTQDVESLQQTFLSQVKHFESISSMYFGNIDGGIVGSGREITDSSYYIYHTENALPGTFLKYNVDTNGTPKQLLASVENFDARSRPWYSTAIHRKTNAWSGIYFLVTGQDMAIAASQPVYDKQNQLLGVVSVDIFLSQLSDFVQNLEISQNGVAYVIERTGNLVVTSSPDITVNFETPEGDYTRINAKDSSTPIVSESANFIINQYNNFSAIDETQQFDLKINNKRNYLQVTPFSDGYGIDWIIVVVVPESDFMGQIQRNTFITILLIVVAIIITILFNIFLVRKINKPVAQLSHFSNLIGNERWEGIKSLNSWILEIDSLGESFMKMGQKLKMSLQNLKDEIEDRKHIENNLRESEDRYRTLVENIPLGVFRTLLNGDVLAANKRMFEMFGYNARQMETNQIFNIIPHYQNIEIRNELIRYLQEKGEVKNFEIEFKKFNGTLFWSSITARLIKDKKGQIILDGIVEDITDQKIAKDKLQYVATHDIVTDLPNRALFEDRLKHAIQLADRNMSLVVVLLIDLDNFKSVNDAFGHKSGDRLLNLIGKRLLTCVRNSDTVARFGGDEFTIILEGIKNLEDTHNIIEKILSSVAEPVVLNNAEVYVTCSIGVSAYPVDGYTADELIQNADHSLYIVKEDGKNDFQFYSSKMKEEVLKRLELKSYLRKALEMEELEIFYQPLINSSEQSVYGAEALLRWHHPEFGLLFPGSFIQMAEETGLIIPIGTWVLNQACKQMKAWIDQGLPISRVAVNISHRQLKTTDFLETVKNALKITNLPPSMLELELTENILFKETDIDFSILEEIKALGVRLSIDDFGTGFTSLSRLTNFEFQSLKIDRYFSLNIDSQKDASVVQGIILIAQKLGMEIIAEGIETEKQIKFFQNLGCYNFQGWYYSKAVPKHEFKKFIQLQNQSLSGK